MTEDRRPNSMRTIGATARRALTGLSAGLIATVLLAVAGSVVALALAFGSRPPQASVAPVLSVGGGLVGTAASPRPGPAVGPLTVGPIPTTAPLPPSTPPTVSATPPVSIIAPQRAVVVLPPVPGDRETPDPSQANPTPGPDG